MPDGLSGGQQSGATPALPTAMDHEFYRQALAEGALTRPQLDEALGAQQGYADQGILRALPVVVCQLGLLHRRCVEQLLRHLIRRCGNLRIGPYLCLAQIGHGGMGVVYKAHQERLWRLVALKILLRPDMTEQVIARFYYEAQAAARIRHPNIVSALAVGEADGWHYFAMEYVPGRTLSRLVAEAGALPESRAIRITLQVASALAHIHAEGLIHRDVKPSNILVTDDDTAKLCDLGIARQPEVDERWLREAKATVGSHRFISPEQARDVAQADARTDIYSLGLCLFYMVTGQLPFAGVPLERVVREHAKGRLPWAAHANPAVSPEVSWAIARMAAPDPANRYASMAELCEDLRALAVRLTRQRMERREE